MSKQSPPPGKHGKFDPFQAASRLSGGSKAWLRATAFQALCTCLLLAIAKLAQGQPWQVHARFIVLLGIVATWSLALRTIRERLLELMRHCHQASRGLLRRASESGKHLIAVPLSSSQERYIKASIRRLRIIAAGLTIPFFVMPMVWSFLSVFVSFHFNSTGPEGARLGDRWAALALFTLLSACIVAGYFHWAILPLPAPVRVGGAPPRQNKRRI